MSIDANNCSVVAVRPFEGSDNFKIVLSFSSGCCFIGRSFNSKAADKSIWVPEKGFGVEIFFFAEVSGS